MPIDVEDQIAAYGTWLRDNHSTNIRAAATTTDLPAVPAPVSLEIPPIPPPRAMVDRRGRWLAGIAASFLLIGAGLAIVWSNRDAAPDPQANSAPVQLADPEEHLLVVPDAIGDFDVVDGLLATTDNDDPSALSRTIIGRLVDDSFTDLVSLEVYAADWTAPSWTNLVPEAQTSNGTAYINTDAEVFAEIVEDRGDIQLSMTGATNPSDLLSVLDRITITPDGLVTLDNDDERRVLWTTSGVAGPRYLSFYRAIDPDGTTYSVGTDTDASAPTSASFAASAMSTAPLHDTTAWVVTRPNTGNGIATSVVWQQTPNRIVAVSADAEPAAVLSFASTVHPVTPDTWASFVPTTEPGD